jgi:multiple antibiotic resistance protein
LAGLWIFQAMGMTLADFKVGGGVVFMIIAIRIILGVEDERPKATDLPLVGVVPLATPAIVGPAVIANVVLLSQQQSVLFSLAVFFANLLFTMLLLYNAPAIEKLIGQKGTLAISKVFAILLVGLAVMFIRQGVYEIVTQLYR